MTTTLIARRRDGQEIWIRPITGGVEAFCDEGVMGQFPDEINARLFAFELIADEHAVAIRAGNTAKPERVWRTLSNKKANR